MIANWLSNNMSKFSRILCSAGMMVPWMLPERAVAHDKSRYEYINGTVFCDYESASDAQRAVLAGTRQACEEKGTVVEERTPIAWKCMNQLWMATDGGVKCKIPVPHTHDDSDAVMYAGADCYCGNCEYGCES